MKTAVLFGLIILLCGAILAHGEAHTERDVQQVNTTRNSAVSFGPYIEVLRGRDGRDGRDGKEGEKGERGEPGIQGPPGPVGPAVGGALYTRWGRTTCPDIPGTELVYAGIAGGSHFTHTGGGANYLCLPENPEYMGYQSGDYGASYLYGAEYQTWRSGPLPSTHDHNVPCAVCYAESRATVLMLPARMSCPMTWTREYYGYLMSERHSHHRSQFECMDIDPESIPGSAANTDGALFYFNEATCAGLPCPPYDKQKEITCAVCTK